MFCVSVNDCVVIPNVLTEPNFVIFIWTWTDLKFSCKLMKIVDLFYFNPEKYLTGLFFVFAFFDLEIEVRVILKMTQVSVRKRSVINYGNRCQFVWKSIHSSIVAVQHSESTRNTLHSVWNFHNFIRAVYSI